MLVKISPASKSFRPINMISDIRTWCFYSLIDAKHLVEYSIMNGSAIVHVPRAKDLDFPMIEALCASNGFSAEKL